MKGNADKYTFIPEYFYYTLLRLTKTAVFLLSFGMLSFQAKAQLQDSIHYALGSNTLLAKQEHTPFWLLANRWQSIPEQSPTQLFNTEYQHQLRWKEKWQIQWGTALRYDISHNNWQLAQAYVHASYHKWKLSLGRFRQYWAYTDSLLSSGSLGISANALPPPALSLELSDYLDIPFTAGWLQFKGRFSHAWLGNDRYVRGAKLHAKNLYLRSGNKQWKIYAGLNHFAQWGGTHPDGKLPHRLQDYARIVLTLPQKKEDIPTSAPQNIYNALGNHMIVTDIGASLKLTPFHLSFYTQTLFDRGRNEQIYARDDINFLHIFGKDRLLGINIKNIRGKWLQQVLVEYLYTLYQGGEGVFIGQFNYYNNAIYKSGWTYQERSLGTPLFMTAREADLFLADYSSSSPYGIVSNRLKAWHVGLAGQPAPRWAYHMLLTYNAHYGNYYNERLFPQTKRQIYTLMEWSFQINSSLHTQASFAWDHGALTKNYGLMLSLQWNFHHALASAQE